MREMKDSGIEWIGPIPADWSMIRVKHAFIRKNEKAMQEDPIVLSLARSGVRVRDISNNEGQVAESYFNYNPVAEGDLLLNPMDLYSGANCSISYVKGVISPAYINLKSKEGINPIFYDYYFKVQYWLMAFFSYGKGVSFDNRWTLSVETLMNYPLVLPSYEEQCRRADYLECECEKIDSIIAIHQEIIEKLNTYKRSFITETVTKGVNCEVKMKDSGIPFLGKVPFHWNIIKFGKCVTIKSNLVSPEQYYDYPQIAPDCIEKNSGKLLSYKTVHDSGVTSWNHLFFEGQIIYSKIRPLLNKVIIAPFDGLCSADMYPIETTNIKQFIVYLMLSEYFSAQVALVTANRVKMPKINQNELSNIIIALPPVEEQSSISDYLQKKCKVIDQFINKRQLIIDKLVDYKKSLIYEIVTGKRDL